MEMCDRKFMIGMVTSLHLVQNMPKKGQQEKIFFWILNKGQLPTLLM